VRLRDPAASFATGQLASFSALPTDPVGGMGSSGHAGRSTPLAEIGSVASISRQAVVCEWVLPSLWNAGILADRPPARVPSD
jgi:hypothetical protein